MIFEDKIRDNKDAFIVRINEIAAALEILPDWLMAVMMFESGLNPQAVNSSSNAVGLIQFMPATAKSLGTTSDDLYNMDSLQQLEYVYKYLNTYKGKYKSFVDVYLAIFFPAAIGKDDSYVLSTSSLSASTIAKANKIFDKNSDNQITKGEISEYIIEWAKKKTSNFLLLRRQKSL